MRKQLATLLLAFIFCLTSVVPGFAANVNIPAADKIKAMEVMLYGATQEGSLVERMDTIEYDVNGLMTSEPILTRINEMYNYLEGKPEDGSASFATRLNMVEWRLNESMSGGTAKTRIEAAEKLLNGKVDDGALSTRLEDLLELVSYEGGVVPVKQVTLPKDSVIKIQFTQELGNKINKVGDEVGFKAADNLFVNDVLVLPKGATGVGKVKKVVQPGIFGKDGRVDINFMYILGTDGTEIPVFVGELAEQQAKSYAGAAGATIGGMIILGPIGAVGGAFVKGSSVTIPEGSVTYVQTTEDVTMQGVVYTE
ncbi:MAG: hypothetical protein IKT51_01390 [Phascolarctobacterium sp.]|nr:hypothetical protein [Phascolarctobacterium sp.]